MSAPLCPLGEHGHLCVCNVIEKDKYECWAKDGDECPAWYAAEKAWKDL